MTFESNNPMRRIAEINCYNHKISHDDTLSLLDVCELAATRGKTSSYYELIKYIADPNAIEEWVDRNRSLSSQTAMDIILTQVVTEPTHHHLTAILSSRLSNEVWDSGDISDAISKYASAVVAKDVFMYNSTIHDFVLTSNNTIRYSSREFSSQYHVMEAVRDRVSQRYRQSSLVSMLEYIENRLSLFLKDTDFVPNPIADLMP